MDRIIRHCRIIRKSACATFGTGGLPGSEGLEAIRLGSGARHSFASAHGTILICSTAPKANTSPCGGCRAGSRLFSVFCLLSIGDANANGSTRTAALASFVPVRCPNAGRHSPRTQYVPHCHAHRSESRFCFPWITVKSAKATQAPFSHERAVSCAQGRACGLRAA